MSTPDALTREIKAMLNDASARVACQMAYAHTAEWYPSDDLQQRLFTQVRPDGENPAAWLNTLFEQFVAEVAFPEHWTVLEEVALFRKLLHEFQTRRDYTA
jgi:hypothetical protein